MVIASKRRYRKRKLKGKGSKTEKADELRLMNLKRLAGFACAIICSVLYVK